jgi:secreted trypsin-like serine protease
MQFRSLMAITSLLAIACSPSHSGAPDSPADPQVGIVGGTLATGSDPGIKAVLSLRIQKDDQIFCTGVLISRQWLLTAGHCVVAAQQLISSGGVVSVGFTVESKARNVVDHAFVHPDFNIQSIATADSVTTIDVGDIGLMHLSKPAPASAVPANLPKTAVLPDHSVQVQIFGYGLVNSTDQNVDGKLRKVTKNAKVSKDTANLLEDDETNGHGTCNGDSGGPSFLVGAKVPIVIGLVSATLREPALNGMAIGDRCRQPNGLTQVGYYLSWIQKTQAAN